MFTYAFDPQTGSVVCLFSGDRNDDADFMRYLAAIDHLDAAAAGRDDCVVVTVVDAGNPPPDAKWRQKIGERSKTLRTKAIAALVSSSPVIRGVMTVLNWLAPERFREQAVVSTFDEALAWIEARRPGRRALLRGLLGDARTEAAQRARGEIPA
jgi:hypothetical protein